VLPLLHQNQAPAGCPAVSHLNPTPPMPTTANAVPFSLLVPVDLNLHPVSLDLTSYQLEPTSCRPGHHVLST